MTPQQPSTLDAAAHIDAACDRFEQDWRLGQQPRIEDFLSRSPATLRGALFASLLKVELELLQGSGQRPAIDSYQTRFPGQQALLAQIFQQALQATASVARHAAETASYQFGQAAPSAAPARSSATVSAAAVGKKFGRFDLLELLGEGGFGAVYKARDPQLDREVALKIPRKGMLETHEDRERFLREGRAAATLNHPHICPVHEAGLIDGRHYMVMALIDGKPLSKVIDRKPVAERAAASTVRKLALALQEAHDKGVIHRDLKPANIMVDRRGQPVVMDFGLARRFDADQATLTQSGAVMGTPAYMAPEQALSQLDQIGPATDIYSLGVVLYEMLTGQRPFQGDVSAVLEQIVQTPPASPRALRPELDQRLEAICLKMLAKDPRARFGSMREVAAALGEYLKATDPGKTAADAPSAVTQELTALVANVQSQLTGMSRAQRGTWWKWLAGAGVAAALIVLGIKLLQPAPAPATATVRIKFVEKYLSDASLSYFLDESPIEAARLAEPLELAVGDHLLEIKRAVLLVTQFKFRVGAGDTEILEPEETYGPPKDSVPPPPVAHWTFDRSGDEWLRDATEVFPPGESAASFGRVPGIGGGGGACISAEGDGSLIVVDHPAQHIRQSLTLAAWVRPDGKDRAVIVGKGLAPVSYSLNWWDHAWQFSLGFPSEQEGGSSVTISAWGVAEKWTHVAAVFDGVRMKLYLDGELSASHKISESANLRELKQFRDAGNLPKELLDSGQPLQVGRNFRGLLDELQLWDQALTAMQVATLAATTPPEPDDAADREMAQWVLEKEGVVGVVAAAGLEQKIKPGDALPDGPLRLTTIDFSLIKEVRLDETDLKRISRLNCLRGLVVRGSGVTDDAIAALADMKSLVYLNLHATGITSAGLKSIEGLTSLRQLDIGYNQGIDDEALVHVEGMKHLQWLNIWSTRISGSGLSRLAAMPQLTYMEIHGSSLNDDGVKYLAGLPALNNVWMGNERLTDAGIAHLRGHRTMRWLRLEGTQITDASVDVLATLSVLQGLNVGGTQLSADGVARLRKALPNCQISAENLRPQR